MKKKRPIEQKTFLKHYILIKQPQINSTLPKKKKKFLEGTFLSSPPLYTDQSLTVVDRLLTALTHH